MKHSSPIGHRHTRGTQGGKSKLGNWKDGLLSLTFPINGVLHEYPSYNRVKSNTLPLPIVHYSMILLHNVHFQDVRMRPGPHKLHFKHLINIKTSCSVS